MFNIFNNASTLFNAYKKKPQDLYSGPISSVYKPPQAPQGAPRSQMIGGKSVSTTGSVRAPQSVYMPASVQQKKTVVPPPTNPSVPTAKQPTATEAFQQKYNDFLNQSQARKENLAQQNRAAQEQKAVEDAENAKKSLSAQKTNLDELMKGFRDRTMAGSARLDTQANQNKQNARTASGETQRELMETRRDQLGDTERRYSALGTVDSYGTGSFQSANQNVETDFLRMTAKGKQNLEAILLDIDNKLFDKKAEIEDRLAIEDGKYKDAAAQIEQLLAGSETEKIQALRAAALMYQERTGEITDEYESYRQSAEKEKLDAQMKLDEANQADQKLMQVMQGASPEFLTTGVPKTAQDQFIIMKYPKEMETYMKLLTDGKALSGGGSEKQKLISLIDDISSSSGLGRISGLQGVVPLLPGSSEQLVKGQIEQLKALLSLEGRQKLKGSGAISDREMGILERASSLLSQNLSEDQIRQVLTQLKTELSTGQPASINAGGRIKVVDLATGQSGTIEAGEFDPTIYKKI